MSRHKGAGPKLMEVVKSTELLPWECKALNALRSLSVRGRELMVSTCGSMAVREAERNAKAARPIFHLINGGQA